jgi:hypothetical protein
MCAYFIGWINNTSICRTATVESCEAGMQASIASIREWNAATDRARPIVCRITKGARQITVKEWTEES